MNIENLITNDCIHSNYSSQILENGLVPIHRDLSKRGCVRISKSEAAKRMKAGSHADESNEISFVTKSEILFEDENKLKKKQNKDKNKKKKQNKNKKKKKNKKNKKVQFYSEQLDTSGRKPNNGRLLSMILANSFDVRIVKNQVYMYDHDTGMFKLSSKQEITTVINAWIDREREDSYKFTSRDTDEAYKNLITNATLQREVLDSAYNKPYVLCQNGVLKLPSMKLLSFSPKYEFTYGIKASYDENANGDIFNDFIDYVTEGDKDLKHLIQEIMGYALSNYSNKRLAFVFNGVRGTGKSTILDVIRQLVGEEMTCEVHLNQMEHEYYAANVLSSKLNIVPDHNNKAIKDVSKFKSFVSDSDVVTGRNPTEKPFAKRCRTKQLFGQNEFFRFSGVGKNDLDAFFDRILYIPFNRKIKKRIDGFWEYLKPECDYIFTWAMKGLKRLIKNNFEFTKCTASEKLKANAIAQCNPEEIFFENCLKSAEDMYESSSAITEAFRFFCSRNNIKGDYKISNYLESQNIPKTRKRINESGYISSKGNPIYVYKGIRLRNRYRVS